MRLPSGLLTHSVTIERLSGTSARGSVFSAPITRSAHVEHRSAMRVDERPDSETRGTEIVMRVQVIQQLERTVTPGARITLADGTKVVAANVGHLEHRDAPSHTEAWCV